MMKLLCGVTLILTIALSYFIFMPLPATVCEPWKLMLLGATFRAVTHVADFAHFLGLSHYIHLANFAVASFERLVPLEYEEVQTLDTVFSGVHVRVYQLEQQKNTLRRGVVFIHGGGWALGTPKLGSYDCLCRKMAAKLDAVVVTVDYRMSPDVRFPVQYEDCLQAARHFLQRDVLAHFLVDPERVAVCGDSAGGNLAAAVAQQIGQDSSEGLKDSSEGLKDSNEGLKDSNEGLKDSSEGLKDSSDGVSNSSRDDMQDRGASKGFKLQVLIYPVLQALDFNTASYQQNQNVPILYRHLMARYWLEYLGADLDLIHTILLNNHTALDQAMVEPHRSKLDWTVMLPKHVRKHYTPVFPRTGSSSILRDIPALLDVRAAPLLAEQDVLRTVPRAYILTCEHDVLRDDGMMYAQRLELVGVPVTHKHYEDGFHGCVSFAFWPSFFSVGIRAIDDYIVWLQANL